MNDEIWRLVEVVATFSGGALIKSLFDEYKRKRSKKEKAEVLHQLYTALEEMYAKDLALQQELNRLALENDRLKMLIEQLQTHGSP